MNIGHSNFMRYRLPSIFLLLLLTANVIAANSPALTLTKHEQQWLETHSTVSFTGDPNWLPYEAFDKNGNYIGIVSEHLSLISEITGLKFKMSPSTTWTESTEKAKQGLVDILSETDDSDLKSHLNFTTPYVSNPIVITMRNSENYVENIDGIKNKKIALIKDYGYASKIRKKYSHIQFITVDNIQDGLLSVSTGKVDALLCTLALCSYTIAELGLNDVKITGKTEFNTKLALGVQKNLPELLSILNKAIKKISLEQRLAILDNWIKNKFPEQINYKLVYQVAAIAFVLLAIFAFWNRRLSREITLRKSTEEKLRLSHQRILFHRDHTPLGVIEWNTNFEPVVWNQAAENIFGFSKKDVFGQHISKHILPESARETVNQIFTDLLESKGGRRSTNENLTKDGRLILCEWYNTPLVDAYGTVTGVASLVDDVTERKTSEKMIWKQANFDTLTGLPNRNMFHERLTQEMKRVNRDKSSLALLLIDLDQFKEVNDTLGHDAGDILLQEAADRIQHCVRNSDTVARLGGDEFTIILPEYNQNSNIEDIIQKIMNKLEKQYTLGSEIIHISASIGISLYPDDANDIDTLIKNADQAMYAAKRNGRHCFSYFTQSLQDAAQKRLRLTNDLRSAQTNNEFEVYYQPIIDLKSGRIIKAEALLRWQHPKRGQVSPLDFIPLAEETSLINDIGNWVFKQSVQQVKHWNQIFDSDFQVSINVSAVQFKLENNLFIAEWQNYLKEMNVSGQNIVVEITESLLLDAEPEVIDKLHWFRDSGIQVAIDDFGTGYSSLSYLKKFHIDYLKIDKIFINNLEHNPNDVTLCNAIIVMAHTLGLKVIAEGVETAGQRDILINAGCDSVQGYFFSKPVPATECEAVLTANKNEIP